MWHPSKAQWRVIWIAVILGLVFGVAVLMGALLVWQMERAMREATAQAINHNLSDYRMTMRRQHGH